jgi:hypothetical protein
MAIPKPNTTGVDVRPASGFAAVRRLMQPRAELERCELCGLELPPEHPHLIEPATRRLACSCEACALLFSGGHSGRFRRVPRRVEYWEDCQLSDAQWEALRLPIQLAFFFQSSTAGRVVALYPSPAGAVESLLSLEAWQEIEQANPVLRQLGPDVEALLVYRVGNAREHYRAPIDECYKLVGLIRSHWRGLSGGTEVWQEIGRFFAGLKARAHGGGPAHG